MSKWGTCELVCRGKNVHPSWSTTPLQALDQDVVMAHN